MVYKFGRDLNQADFENSAKEVTAVFQKLSFDVKSCQSKLDAFKEDEKAKKLSKKISKIQELEKQHLLLRVHINDKIIKLHLL